MKQYGTNTGQGNYDDETYVPGSEKKAPGVDDEQKSNENSKAIVGFLFSISRTAKGEYWPLHLGKNTIGSNSSCDIRLLEGTVSKNDVHITIQRKQNTLKAVVFDMGSDNGVLVNGEEVDIEKGSLSCKTYDVIQVGCAYKLLLILVDVDKIGLTVAEDFQPISGSGGGSAKGGSSKESRQKQYDPTRREKKHDDGTVNENGAPNSDYDPTQT